MALEGDGQVPPWPGDHEPWLSPRIPGCRSIPAHRLKINGFKPHQEQGWSQVKQI